MQKLKILLALAFCVFGVFISLICLQNRVWVGQVCESSAPEMKCDRIASGTERQYFLSLNSCKLVFGKMNRAFVCASGPNPDLPEATMYSSFRYVFDSEANSFMEREVPFAFFQILLP